MLPISSWSRAHRLTLGVFVLLLVDVIWVASSEITEYIFKDTHFEKPFFSTYLKTSLFMVYLTGFLFLRSWRLLCRKGNTVVDVLEDNRPTDSDQPLSEPIYVPIRTDADKSSGTESDDGTVSAGSRRSHESSNRSVRFNSLSEVRQLSEDHAEDATLARLSYSAYQRAEEYRMRYLSKFTVRQVAKIALMFAVLFFFGNFSYQEALKNTEASIVNVLSASSSLFTLVLAAIFPSSSIDKFTLSKLVAVLFSMGGVVLVSVSDINLENGIPLGALWALCGALFYATYLVLFRKKVDNEDRLDITMFFGFVGLFIFLVLWPGFFILHFTKAELFNWPSKMDWVYLVANGIIGTVVSELLWLWGCFLTSSLLATVSLSLTIPLTMIADTVVKKISYNWMFYVGSAPIFLAFFAIAVLNHYENWDPVCICVKKLTRIHCFCRRRLIPTPRLIRDLDNEQRESLIGINPD
ncbi:solute carrier family 35 member F5-like [Tubulanus polymorphus]|uniref:solute carrier family 35 member F5-like n=1 Tax=Tubulanus polymorphus TaxID=672921 RepID=UPI003DA67F2E